MTAHPVVRRATRARNAALSLLVPLVAAALVSAVPASAAPVPAHTASATPPSAACVQEATPAGIYGLVHAKAPAGCRVQAPRALGGPGASAPLVSGYGGGNPPLLSGGGSVVGTPSTTGENTVHALFWAPPGYSFPSGYEAGIETYLTDVAAASGTSSNVYSVATQYTDALRAGTPHLRYLVHAGAPVVVGDAYPSGGCTPDSGSGESYQACLTDSQIRSELTGTLAADGLPTGMGDVYLVILPPRVESCLGTLDAAAGGTCSDTAYSGYCGYHSATGSGSAPALYADIPYPTAYSYSCVGTESPHGFPELDSVLSLISHEHNETITDPTGRGWMDSIGYEDGDECAWNFGAALGGSTGAQWNQVINGDHYELQQEFSNEDFARDPAAGCALTQDLPTASLAVTTAQPVPGAPTAFDGTASSVANVPNGIVAWAWDFGDGAPGGSGPTPAHTYAAAGDYTVTLTVTDTDGFTAATSRSVVVGTPAGPPVTSSATQPVPDGYWLVGSDGGIFSFGSAGFYGSTGSLVLQRPVKGISPTADRRGYWLVASDGGIFAFGDAGFHGSLPGLGFAPAGSGGAHPLAAPIVAMVPSTDDGGYFMVASDGGVFAFGDARFAGSCPGIGGCSGAAVAVMPDATGDGYWLVTATGSVYAFGDAPYLGALPVRAAAVTSAVRTPDGGGYWVLYSDGTLVPFGDAGNFGDPAGALGGDEATAVFATADGAGYWIATASGGVHPYGDATAAGSMAGTRLNAPIIAASGW